MRVQMFLAALLLAAAIPGRAQEQLSASATILPTAGNEARGTIGFESSTEGTLVRGRIGGLQPGQHGFHIHQFGDCSDPAADSAGPHYNPSKAAHGGPESPERHLGDLGNVTAGPDGVAKVSILIKDLPISGIIGRALVIHIGPDDLRSDPAGNSGKRVGCGVIGIARPPE